MANRGKTPAQVADKATRKGALKDDQTTVIGVFGPEQAMKAMIWLPGGRIKTVKKGARLAQGRIVGIDAKGVMILRGGETLRLTLPGG